VIKVKELIQKALDRSGYGHFEPNEENLVNCFLDYVDHGVFGNLDYDEAKELIEEGEITLKMMCSNLIKMR
jgi:hypothetical protein